MPVAMAGRAGVSVRTVTPGDEELIVSTIVMAFSADPAARWAYPHPDQYLKTFPRFVRAFGGQAFAHESAHIIEGGVGAALWLPPHVEPDEEQLGILLTETVSPKIQKDVLAVFEQMGNSHPKEPHWYLPMIGVDTLFQGRGYGSALLQYALAVCDRDGTPAYLESSNPRNVPLYKRHGFELIGTIQAGSSPKMYPMLRKPQSRSGR